MKVMLRLLLLIFCLFSLHGQAAALESVNVALLPLEDTAAYHLPEVDAVVKSRLQDHFRFPFYEKIIVSPSEAHLVTGKKSIEADSMAALAKAKQADLVIGVELVYARSDIKNSGFTLWNDNSTVMQTDVEVAIYAYSLSDGKYQSWRERLSKEEDLSVNSGVKAAVETLLEKLLFRLPYKRIPTQYIP
ncbi:hypothetical protein [Azotosporobacter soli]|uniref:hypothetical protein n=1 Tax=Azotosporobacter soli TaxID=3055040 RepID=UPI0031FF1EB5